MFGFQLSSSLVTLLQEDLPDSVLGAKASEIMYTIWKKRPRMFANIDVHDVQWACCEFRKVWRRHPHRLRRAFRRNVSVARSTPGPSPSASRKRQLPVLPSALLEVQKYARRRTAMAPEDIGGSLTPKQRNKAFEAMARYLGEHNADAAQKYGELENGSWSARRAWLVRFCLDPHSGGLPSDSL